MVNAPRAVAMVRTAASAKDLPPPHHLVHTRLTVARGHCAWALRVWCALQVWRFVSPLLDKRTQAKICICGGRHDYLPRLLERIDAECLPDFLGGNDTTCDFVSERGPWAGRFPCNAPKRTDG